MSVRPYRIAVSDECVQDLKVRLANAAFPDELDGSAWDLGSPLSDVKRLAARWRDGYDWRAAESRINSTLQQYTTRIKPGGFEAVDVHFVHHTSAVPGAIPLLFVHGCMWALLALQVLR